MKKMLPLIVLLLALFFCACEAKPSTNASKKALAVATQAVQALDGYLDGELSGKECSDKLDGLNGQMAYVHDFSAPMSDDERADWNICFNITMANHEVIMDWYDGNPDTFQKVIDYRNELATIIGEKPR